MNRVKWEMGRYATERGIVGKLEMFSLTMSTRRDSTDWSLRTELPGIMRDHQAPSQEAAKQKAEELLASWLRLTGVAE